MKILPIRSQNVLHRASSGPKSTPWHKCLSQNQFKFHSLPQWDVGIMVLQELIRRISEFGKCLFLHQKGHDSQSNVYKTTFLPHPGEEKIIIKKISQTLKTHHERVIGIISVREPAGWWQRKGRAETQISCFLSPGFTHFPDSDFMSLPLCIPQGWRWGDGGKSAGGVTSRPRFPGVSQCPSHFLKLSYPYTVCDTLLTPRIA